MPSFLRNPAVIANAVTFFLSLLVTLGIVKAGTVSADDVASIAGGFVSLLTAVNAVVHGYTEYKRKQAETAALPTAPQ